MIAVFLGAPGSGKGTQAKLLGDRYGSRVVQLSTGDALRKAIQEGSSLGQTAKGFMDRGELIPDDLISGVVAGTIANWPKETLVILDGFPRTLAQAKSFDEILRTSEHVFSRVVEFQVPESVLVERLTGRLTCGSCQSMFHKELNPPKKQGVCDRCGSNLVVRADDEESVVLKRLKVYLELTEPLIDFYGDRGLVESVDANLEMDEVFQQLVVCLGLSKA